MDDMQAIEQRIAAEMLRRAGPSLPVDDLAVFDAVSATSRSHRRGFTMFSALKFIAAGVIVALIGGFLFASLATPPVEDALPAAAPSGPGTFSPAGSLEMTRAAHTATLLPDGRVLVVGGFRPSDGGNIEIASSPTAEIWDPATTSFGPAGRLTTPRDGHAATLLPDGGVLVIGGWGNNVTSVEAWDPETESFSPAGSLTEPRLSATGTLLPDGRILVVGGLNPAVPRNSAELWDPTSASSQFGGVMGDRRWAHTATLLPDGRVLVVGGMDGSHPLASAELWDPAAGSFEPTGSLAEGRDFHTATLLPDGRVLVVGGAFSSSSLRTSAELWDPATGSFSPAGSLAIGRSRHTATLLPDGRVLIVGGDWENAQGSAELWDPATESFSPAASMAEGRWGHTATLLSDGRVLVVGGSSSPSAEVWAPGAGEPAADEVVGTSALQVEEGPLVYVPMGNSLTFFPMSGSDNFNARYAAMLEADFGVDVEVRPHTVPGQRTDDFLEQLRTDDRLREDLGEADVVTLLIPNDEWAEPFSTAAGAEGRDPSDCGGEDHQQCLRDVIDSYKQQVDRIFDELTAIVDPAETLIRVQDFYQFMTNAMTPEAFDLTYPYWREGQEYVEQVAGQHGIPVAQVFDDFMGTDGLYIDLVADGLVGPDGVHPSAEGAGRMATLVHDLGYDLAD